MKGCLRIDLDEGVVDSQKAREDSETVVVGGSRTVPEVQNFSKVRLRRTASEHSLGYNSEKLLGFEALFFAIPPVEMSDYTPTKGPRPWLKRHLFGA